MYAEFIHIKKTVADRLMKVNRPSRHFPSSEMGVPLNFMLKFDMSLVNREIRLSTMLYRNWTKKLQLIVPEKDDNPLPPKKTQGRGRAVPYGTFK